MKIDGSVMALATTDHIEPAIVIQIGEDSILVCSGQLDLSRDEPSLKLSEVKPLDGILDQGLAGQLIIDLKPSAELPAVLDKIQSTLLQSVGENPVFFRIQDNDGKAVVHRVDEEYFVRISDDLVEQIQALTGPGSTSLR